MTAKMSAFLLSLITHGTGEIFFEVLKPPKETEL